MMLAHFSPVNDDSLSLSVSCRDFNHRLMELLMKPENLSREEWEEVLECERQGREYELLLGAGYSHERALELVGGRE